MSEKVIYKNKKLDVRRIEFHQDETNNNVQANYILHTATEKETLMGSKIKVSYQGAAASANTGTTAWKIYIADSGDPLTLTAADVLDGEVKREVVFTSREKGPDGQFVWNYRLETKQKRKISKGQVIYLSILAAAVNAAIVLDISGIMYIGE